MSNLDGATDFAVLEVAHCRESLPILGRPTRYNRNFHFVVFVAVAFMAIFIIVYLRTHSPIQATLLPGAAVLGPAPAMATENAAPSGNSYVPSADLQRPNINYFDVHEQPKDLPATAPPAKDERDDRVLMSGEMWYSRSGSHWQR